MSLSPPRTRANGTRNFSQYSCYQCHRPVSIASGGPSNEAVCPECFRRFLYHIDSAGNRSVFELITFDPSPGTLIFEASILMLSEPRGQNCDVEGSSSLDTRNNHGWGRHRIEDLEDSRNRSSTWTRRTSLFDEGSNNWGPESTILARSRPLPQTWVILRRMDPNPIGPNRSRERSVPLEVNLLGYHEVIEEPAQNDRHDLSLANHSTIDQIPTSRIASTHLEADTECPICKEKLNIGMEVREISYNHVYHSDCIANWLRIRNTCPVCRKELAAPLPKSR
ncbi:hypothetical protein OROHE_018593 [Orobanche hederae]